MALWKSTMNIVDGLATPTGVMSRRGVCVAYLKCRAYDSDVSDIFQKSNQPTNQPTKHQ
jgi:hypothetical protein